MYLEKFWDLSWRYFWGVGVGLVIAWVTGFIAYYKAGGSALPLLIMFEAVLSAILLIAAVIMRYSGKGKRG